VLYEAIRTHRAVLDAGLGRDVFCKCCSERGSVVKRDRIALHVSDLVPRITLVRKASQRSRRRVWLPLANAVLYEAIRTHRAVLDAGLGRDVFSKCCSERGSVGKRDRDALHVSDRVSRIAHVRKACQRSRRRVWPPFPNAVLYEAIRTLRAVEGVALLTLDAELGRDVFLKCFGEREW